MNLSAHVFTAQILHANVVKLITKKEKRKTGEGKVVSQTFPPVRQNRLTHSSLLHPLTPHPPEIGHKSFMINRTGSEIRGLRPVLLSNWQLLIGA